MPELPEVEVVRLYLQKHLLNKNISKLEILTPKSFIGNSKLVEGQKIVKLSRVGKQLSLHLSNKLILLVHLKMTGQLILKKGKSRQVLGHPTKDMFIQTLPHKSTRLIFHFSPPSSRGVSKGRRVLYFNDQRKFGWIKLFSPNDLAKFQSSLGLDIFDPIFTPKYLFSQLQRSQRAVKLVLLDQHFFAGIGNIYANDALFLSKIHPSVPASTLSKKQSQLLHRHLVTIMKKSVSAGGSTTKDQKYLRPDGTIGQNQFNFQVYQKKGQPCSVCQAPIQFIKIGGRGTFFCPHCQVNL
jgi:formamidopyrimidine-DNA glycosylase